MVVKNAMFEAVPNFSEGRDRQLMAALAAGPHVLDVHADADHNRCVVTLAAADVRRLAEGLFAMVALAVERIDLRQHAGVHPRVGAADVIPFVPLGDSAMAAAVAAAHELGERVWRDLHVPVYFYGAAGDGRNLAGMRAGRDRPDLGDDPHPTAGIACIGARPPLVAYNLLFAGLPVTRVREMARQMRRLAGVQALAFDMVGGAAQLSMNLTRLGETAVPAAFARACELAGQAGVPELVGLCPAVAAGPGCDGGLLEPRLAAAAASAAASEAAALGSEEMTRLADRLLAEAGSLAAIPADPEAILGGAERAAALYRVLAAAGLSVPEADVLLVVAARGLRAALSPVTVARFARRVVLLDTWLAAVL